MWDGVGCAIRDADTDWSPQKGLRSWGRVSINSGTDGGVAVAEEAPMKISP